MERSEEVVWLLSETIDNFDFWVEPLAWTEYSPTSDLLMFLTTSSRKLPLHRSSYLRMLILTLVLGFYVFHSFTWSFACWSSWSQMTRRRECLVELEPWRPRYHRPNRQHCPSNNWLKHVIACSDYLANEWWFLGQFCVAFLTTGLGAELAEVGWGNVLDDQEGLAVDGALLELENAKTRLFWVLVTWITAQTRPNGRLSL